MSHFSMPTDQPSELQNMIAATVERLFAKQVNKPLLERFDAGRTADDLWQQLAELGLPLALAPESAGGSAANWQEIGPLLRAIGYWQLPLPLGETLLGAWLLAQAGLVVPEGPITLIQDGRQARLRINTQRGGLDGIAGNVPWSQTCHWAVAVQGDQLALVDLRQAAVTRLPGSNFAGEERDSLTFTQATCEALGRLEIPRLDEPVWQLGALLRACTLSGALEAALDMAVNHANERVQFGRPIGGQQAIQQQLAHLAGAVASARMTARVALQALDDPDSVPDFDIAAAKVCASEAASLACSVTHQVHGAIGFTHEHRLHSVTRRLWSWREEFGSDSQWAQVLGKAAIAAGSAGFWRGLSARSL